MKLFITLLTHHNLPSLKRLVKSFENQNPESYIDTEAVIVVNTLSDEYYQSVLDENFSLKVIRTRSNGKPGKGKNSCRDLFLKSDADFMSQIDGDDLLYPTYVQSIAQHIQHYPNIDVLGIIPNDLVARFQIGGHNFQFGDNDEYWGSVWGVSLVKRPGHGAGQAHWVDDPMPCNYDRIILQSKLSAQIRMDEVLPNGEDHLYSIQLLAEHQKRNLRYFVTMSSDLYLTDSTFDNTVQNQFPFEYYVEEMKTKMLKHVAPWRSSQDELPIIFNEILLSQEDKEAIIKKIF